MISVGVMTFNKILVRVRRCRDPHVVRRQPAPTEGVTVVFGRFPQDVGGVADETRVESVFEIRGKGVHAPAALLCDGPRNLCRHLFGRRAFSPRVAEDVQSRKGQLLDKGDRLLELFVGLSWEADDDVGGDCEIGHGPAGVVDQCRELPRDWCAWPCV